MEIKEAVNLLNNIKAGVKKYDEAIAMAVDALEKQMQKPVVKKRPEDKHTGKCPVCGTPMRVLDTRDCKFCYHCGQAIDWDA